MVTRSTESDTILYSDRVPVFLGVNGFFLKQGLQSSNRSIETPNEIIKEQGNAENRGMTIDSPEITVSFEDLAVDLDMEQLLAETQAVIGTRVGSNELSGTITYAVGPTDKLTKQVLTYVSGGYVRVGKGAPITSATATTVTLTSAADAVNFAVGNRIIAQKNGASTNSAGEAVTITKISGSIITTSSLSVMSGLTDAYIYVNDVTPVSSATWVLGKPAKSVKGLEVYCTDDSLNIGDANVYIVHWPITAAGTDTKIESNDFRNSEIDVLMLYNDYDDNIIYSRYMQDVAVTSLGLNFSSDGNATQNYDFSTGKTMDYAGYVNRRAVVVASGTSYDLSTTANIFEDTEVNDPVRANTTLNENSFEKAFLKVQTLDTNGVRKIWKEVHPDTVTLKTDEYKYVTTTITFGDTITLNTRLEITYLCQASLVDDADAYKFDDVAFDHTGKPTAVAGKYQPLTINTEDFDNRIDGVESTSINLSFTRDYFKAQGIMAQRVKPSQIGEVDGSISTREGFSKIMNLLATGNQTMLTDKQQIDATTASNFTFVNDIPLRVRLYSPADNTSIVKTVEIDKIQITNVTNSNSVGDDSTFEISFTGTKGNVKFSR
jgi:hypothetical protein